MWSKKNWINFQRQTKRYTARVYNKRYHLIKIVNGLLVGGYSVMKLFAEYIMLNIFTLKTYDDYLKLTKKSTQIINKQNDD